MRLSYDVKGFGINVVIVVVIFWIGWRLVGDIRLLEAAARRCSLRERARHAQRLLVRHQPAALAQDFRLESGQRQVCWRLLRERPGASEGVGVVGGSEGAENAVGSIADGLVKYAAVAQPDLPRALAAVRVLTPPEGLKDLPLLHLGAVVAGACHHEVGGWHLK